MDLPHHPVLPTPVRLGLNFLDCVRKMRARRYGVNYSYLFLDPNGKDLDELRGFVEEGKMRTVVGKTVLLKDVEAVRDACQVVYSGRGGVGKTVVKVVE